jgi:RNA polymerase sigma-70 factor (ECF subfamily)
MTRSPAVQPDRAREEYAALVRNAAGGDAAAMERLLIRAQEVAYRFSLLVCGHVEDAEDVMQDALLGTYRHVREITDPSAFRTWLYSTVRNACLMKRRRRAGEPASFVPVEQGGEREGRTPGVDVPSPAPRPDERMVDAWIDRRLRRALASLPPAYRMIVVLREIEGLPTKEVAAVIGISEANVKTRLHRAHGMLRKQLQDV